MLIEMIMHNLYIGQKVKITAIKYADEETKIVFDNGMTGDTASAALKEYVNDIRNAVKIIAEEYDGDEDAVNAELADDIRYARY